MNIDPLDTGRPAKIKLASFLFGNPAFGATGKNMKFKTHQENHIQNSNLYTSSPPALSLSVSLSLVTHSSMAVLYESVTPDTQHERLKFFTATSNATQQISTVFTCLSHTRNISSSCSKLHKWSG